jgi:hypothetical protein
MKFAAEQSQGGNGQNNTAIHLILHLGIDLWLKDA